MWRNIILIMIRLPFQETGVYEPSCLVKVDEFAFFIYWKSEGRVGFFFLLVWLSSLGQYLVLFLVKTV